MSGVAITKARAAWGDTIPGWIEALARACDEGSQAKVAKRVGYSAATLSYVLNSRYTGDLAAVEQAVRGALMAESVNCPVMGDLAANTCLELQRAEWSARRAMIKEACRSGCPHSRINPDEQRARRAGGTHAV